MPVRGVLHVGAHVGQELESYLACGFDPLLLVEPNPHVFPYLREHVRFWQEWLDALSAAYGGRRPRLRAVQAAADSGDGEAVLHLTERAPQSSLLPPRDSGIREVSQVTVRTLPVDAMLAGEGVEPGDLSLLVVDVQGAEDRVLRGAAGLLAGVEAVLVEVNDEARYEGSPLTADLDALLGDAGFRRVWRSGPFPDCPAGDALYTRGGASR